MYFLTNGVEVVSSCTNELKLYGKPKIYCLAFKINKKRIFIHKHSARNTAFRGRKFFGTFEKRTPEHLRCTAALCFLSHACIVFSAPSLFMFSNRYSRVTCFLFCHFHTEINSSGLLHWYTALQLVRYCSRFLFVRFFSCR